MKLEEFLKSEKKKYLLSNTSHLSLNILKNLALDGIFSINTYETDIKKLVKEITKEKILGNSHYISENEAIFLILKILNREKFSFFTKNEIDLSLAREFYNLFMEVKLLDGKIVPKNKRLEDFKKVMDIYDKEKSGYDYADSVKLALDIPFNYEIGYIDTTDLRYLEKELLLKNSAKSLELRKNITFKDGAEVHACFSSLDEIMNLIYEINKIKENEKITIVYTDPVYLELLRKFSFTNLNLDIFYDRDLINLKRILKKLLKFYDGGYMVKDFLVFFEDTSLSYKKDYELEFVSGLENYKNDSNESLYEDRDRISLLLKLVENDEINFNTFKSHLLEFVEKYLEMDLETVKGALYTLNADVTIKTRDVLNLLIQNLDILKKDHSKKSFIEVYSIDEQTIYRGPNIFFVGMSENYFTKKELESPVLQDDELLEISKNARISKKRSELLNNKRLSKVKDSLRPNSRVIFSYSIMNEENEEDSLAYEILRLGLNEKKINYLDYMRPSSKKNCSKIMDLQYVVNEFIFSASSLELFMNDPRAFYMNYILGICDEYYDDDMIMNIPMYELGTIIHTALELYIKDSERLDHFTNLNEKMDFFDREFLKLSKKTGSFDFLTEDIRDRYRKMLFKKLIYLSENLKENKKIRTEVGFGEIYGRDYLSKDPIVLKFGKYNLKFRGRMDRIDESEDEIVIIDYKTGSSRNLMDRDENNELYQHYIYKCVMEKFTNKKVRFVYDFLGDGKTYEPLEYENFSYRIEKMLSFVEEYGFFDGKRLLNVPQDYNIFRKRIDRVELAKMYSKTCLVDEDE